MAFPPFTLRRFQSISKGSIFTVIVLVTRALLVVEKELRRPGRRMSCRTS